MNTKYEDKQERSETVKLKKKVRELASENRRLKSELNTLMDAWQKTENYLKDLHANKTLSEVIENVKTDDKFKEAVCPECGSKDLKLFDMKVKLMRICQTCKFREIVNAQHEENE